jgi:hypothetical protein
MPQRVFFSYHHQADQWRAAQVINAGVVQGNQPASAVEWEAITRGGEPAIRQWIEDQLTNRSCVVVLIGSATAGRKWITYEIEKAWNDGRGVLGIHIHRLKDESGEQAPKGPNPLDFLTITPDRRTLSTIGKTYDPPFTSSIHVYDYIKQNLEAWVEEAVSIRNDYWWRDGDAREAHAS